MFPTVGGDAPAFSTEVYFQGQSTQLSSDQLQGKWYVLYFYSGDFTFV